MNEARDRLSTTDEAGRRILPHPADVKGWFRTRRTYVYAILMIFYLVLPWIKINGHQSLLLDVIDRKLIFFGFLFQAHDIPLLLLLASIFVFGIMTVTAIWGRVWCGWACPQTVFIDVIFRRIERLVEGDGFTRRKLDRAPWDVDKTFKRTIKWISFICVSFLIAHSVLAYLVGIERLGRMITSPPRENLSIFLAMLFISSLVLFDFGWFREQFCIIMCPYGRFQSVLMDERSLVISYDQNRGEPRRGSVPEGGTQGDCVNCLRCIQVCPTAIDIRKGVQLECVACSSCIDACDEVMTKIKKPLGLISYSRAKPGVATRSLLFGCILLGLFVSLVFMVKNRSALDITLVRATQSPYQLLPGDMVSNHFRLHIVNQTFESKTIYIRSENKLVEVIVANQPIEVLSTESKSIDIFVKVPKNFFELGKAKTSLVVDDSHHETREEVQLIGPF